MGFYSRGANTLDNDTHRQPGGMDSWTLGLIGPRVASSRSSIAGFRCQLTQLCEEVEYGTRRRRWPRPRGEENTFAVDSQDLTNERRESMIPCTEGAAGQRLRRRDRRGRCRRRGRRPPAPEGETPRRNHPRRNAASGCRRTTPDSRDLTRERRESTTPCTPRCEMGGAYDDET